jgi:hypothetical protein
MTIEDISEINPDALVCDGFDEAIIGMAERINLGPVVAYDVDKMIDIMVERDGMTYEEALEYFNFNILGAWMGEFTPVFISKNPF